MQGYGLFVLEEMLYSPEGTVMTRGPGAYKIPGFSDIPTEFNVSLLKGSSNPRAVYSSKAVGEPPLFLASSVLFAIREAIIAARKEQNIQESFQLDAPATAEKIRMFCVDNIIKKASINCSKTAIQLLSYFIHFIYRYVKLDIENQHGTLYHNNIFFSDNSWNALVIISVIKTSYLKINRNIMF